MLIYPFIFKSVDGLNIRKIRTCIAVTSILDCIRKKYEECENTSGFGSSFSINFILIC